MRMIPVVLSIALIVALSLAAHYRQQAKTSAYERDVLSAEHTALSAAYSVVTAKVATVTSVEAPKTDASDTAVKDTELLERLAEMQVALEQKDQVILGLKYQVTNRVPVQSYAPEAREDWLEDLKVNDPERYDEIMNRREEARDRMRDGIARKAADLVQRDTSEMTVEEEREYELLLQVLNDAWRLSDRMKADLPQEERRDLRREMRRTMRTLSPLLYNERTRQFYRLGLDFGYTENEAVEFVEYLNEIVEQTSTHSIWHGERTNIVLQVPTSQP